MGASVEKIENLKIEFDERRILRLIGYKKKFEKIKEPIKRLIEEEKNKLDYLLHPASIYTIIDYDETNKHPIFKGAKKVALCICTIGPELEKEINELMRKNEMDIGFKHLGSKLLERSDVVHYPEAAPIGGHYQVVEMLLDNQPVHRCMGKI